MSNDLNACRLGLSKNFMKKPAKDNFPTYTTHQCMVRKHLTPEVSLYITNVVMR